MRVRDLRWYILISAILVVAYAAVAWCYYLSISSGKVESSMKILGLEAAKEDVQIISKKISNYYDLYIDDINNDNVYSEGETSNGRTFERFVNQDATTLTYLSNWYIQNGGNITAEEFDKGTATFYTTVSAASVEVMDQNKGYDQNLYCYFVKPDTSALANNGYLLTRVLLKNLIGEDTLNIALVSNDIVTYSNFDYVKELLSLSSYIGSSWENDYKSVGYLNSVYTIEGHRTVVSVVDAGSELGQFVVFYDITDAFIGIDWVLRQAIIFYTFGILVCAAMLVLFILGTRRTSQLLRADRHALQKTEAIVIRVALNGDLIFSNKTFKKLYGITREVLIKDFIDVDTKQPIMNTMKKNKAFICEIPLDEIRDKVAYLQLTPLEISRSYYLMGTDVTLEYNESQRLQLMSGRNEITDCDNGFILANKFEKIIKEDTNGLDVAFVEINIHKYNDLIQVFGRTTYNEMLVEFLKMISAEFEDLNIYHIDQSKFIVIFPNTNIDEVTTRADNLLESLRKPVTIRTNNIYINAKIVVYNLKRDLVDRSLVSSDENDQITLKMIETKLDLAYRNIGELSSKDYVIYEPAMDNIILATDEMERDIETGLIDKEFQMWLQPQFDIINNRVDGFEALIRWMNPKYKDKSPQVFIELAEKRGHMLDIGRFVITESFKLAKRLEPYGVHISINVSPVQLLQVGFVQQLIDEFNKNQLKTGSIAIEITETLLMGSFKLVAEKLRILKDNGFHIHLDDFCTGYSSMLYLKDLPVDTIKIDKEFTKFIVTNKFNENIVKTLCTLAKDLDLDLVCEGVEQQEQADMVKKFGCRVIQGWLYGKAMPYEQAVDMLEKYNTGSIKRK